MAGNFLAAYERPAILNRALRPADFTWFAKAREGEQALIFARLAASQSVGRCCSDRFVSGAGTKEMICEHETEKSSRATNHFHLSL
jgi:hypothetical protein